jgi:hypothetical protein
MASEWRFIGGMFDGVLVYEQRDPPVRAYVVQEPDGLRVAGFDGDAAPARLALEEAVTRDLGYGFSQMMVGDRDSGNAASISELLPFLGINPMTAIKTNRGSKPKLDDAELRAFAADYIASGDTKGRRRRRTLDVMRQAERAGHVEVTRCKGRPNAYRLMPETKMPEAPAVSGDRERSAWFGLRRFAAQLDANWRCQVAHKPTRADSPPI